MKRTRLTLAGAAMLLMASLAGATSLVHLGDTEMALQSDAIVIGRCASATTEWVRGTLVTLVSIEISETLKGATARELTLVIPGGIDTSRPVPVSVIFPGAPSVVRDESVLLYLEESVLYRGGYDVAGFNQGKFSVVEADGQQFATRGGELTPLDLKRAQISAALAGE